MESPKSSPFPMTAQLDKDQFSISDTRQDMSLFHRNGPFDRGNCPFLITVRGGGVGQGCCVAQPLEIKTERKVKQVFLRSREYAEAAANAKAGSPFGGGGIFV
jgi:hypothetical protein